MTPIARRRMRRALRSEIALDLLLGSLIIVLVASIVVVGSQLW